MPFFVILTLNYEKLAEKNGWDKIISDTLEVDLTSLPEIILNPITGLVSLSVVMVTIGIWLDVLVGKLSEKRPTKKEKIKQMGERTKLLATYIENELDGINLRFKSDFTSTLKTEIYECAISLSKYRIHVPKSISFADELQVKWAISYFSRIGALLSNGKVKAAIKLSNDWDELIAQSQIQTTE